MLPGLDLDPMTFIHELDPNSAEMYRMSENELPIRQGIPKLSSNRHRDTERQTDSLDVINHTVSWVVNIFKSNQIYLRQKRT